MKPSELAYQGTDNFDRAVYQRAYTNLYYCVGEPDRTLVDVLAGTAQLFFKGTREGEPEYPVTLQPEESEMDQPTFEPESGITRQEFFKWLHECPSDWAIIEDHYGETEVRFMYHEEPDEEKE